MNNELKVRIKGELRPEWMIHLEDAIADAAAAGWILRTDVVLEGAPYTWKGRPEMSRWTVKADD